LRIVLFTKVPEDSSLLQRWNDLVLQTEHPEVFYTGEWALAAESAFQGSRKPLLLAGYDGDDLVGVVCLSLDRDEENVSFLTATTADYCDLLSHPARRAEFVEAVFAQLRQLGIIRIVFANLPADSATPVALRTVARKYGFHLHIRPAYRCPQLGLGSVAQRQQLKDAMTRKRQLRRCLKALEREGQVSLNYARSWEQIQTALPDFVDTHVARFRAKHSNSFLSTPERRFFMEDLARRFSRKGIVTFTTLMVGEQPVAWSYGFQFQGNWSLYQTTFDTRWEKNSPGYCLLAKILIEACEMSSLKRVEFGLGAEAYKEWFANSTRQTLHATLTTSPLRHFQEIARYRVAIEVKRFPKVEAAIRSARSRLGL
jgi:CelD/BcsL family acetyltransferase involved in cellulose biosynthesis